MNQFQLSVPYRSTTAPVLVTFCLIWLVVGIFASVSFGAKEFTWLAVLLIIPPGILFTNFIEGNKIIASKDGLSFPGLFSRGSNSGRFRKWSDVAGVSISTSDPQNIESSDYLLIRFRSGGQMKLKLKKLQEADLERLLLAFQMFAPDAEYGGNLQSFRDSLENKNLRLDGISYTRLWEEELNRRFSSTNFLPLKPGAKLKGGKLIVERQLAFGGFSAVYLVRDADGKATVVKELCLAEHSDGSLAKARDLFKREAEILGRLGNPHIAKILDHFSEEGREYILLEHVAGNNLRQRINSERPRCGPQTLDLAIQMATILEYLHTLDTPITHRDFTPDNLVLNNDGELVLIDFGAANEFLTEVTGTLIGKQCYMPPEQIRGKAALKSDVYSMGGTMYFLLTGEDPVPLSSSRPSNRIDGLIPELDDLVSRMTHLDILLRPSIQDVRKELETLRELAPAAQIEGSLRKVHDNR